jgi:protein-export membrane protein SecD
VNKSEVPLRRRQFYILQNRFMPKKNPVSDILGVIGRGLRAVILPQTPRGKIRQAVIMIVLLLFFAGNLSQPKYWNDFARWSNDTLGVQVPDFWNPPYRLGLDLQGGTHLIYKADVSAMPDSEKAEAISGVRDVIERRVDAFGVSEPLVQTNKAGDDWRVTVDLAGVKDISEAIAMIGETPILEFKESNPGEPARELTEEESAMMEAWNTEAEATADEVLDSALADADFSELVAEYTANEIEKGNDGQLGWVGLTGSTNSLLAETLVDEGVALNEVIPKAVRTTEGFNIYRYTESRESGKEFKASHILVCWEGKARCESERTEEEAKALIDNLSSRATISNFAALAEQNSDDASNASDGGSLGWFGEGAMVPEFEEAVMSLGVGEISEPVLTDFGYHLVLKDDERPITEYLIQRVLIETKEAADYLPAPDPWKNTELSGQQLKKAMLQFDANTGIPQVSLEFNDEGKDLFAEITERNVNQPVAIFLDGEAISTPIVQEKIIEGSAVITGDFNIQEAKLLARRLNAGALPVPIVLESQQSVGASLGQESLDKSLYAAMIGFLLLIIFMLIYYRLPGIIATFALILYTAVNLALYKIIPVTLTLSGIAGFILSVGMAVDANILIFERLKEELKRGRSLRSAIDEGFNRAWLSIRDSNLTTLLSCSILYFTSSSLIKGFALTLGLGVLISMFSAITVSRTLLRLVAGWPFLKNALLYLPGFNRMPESQTATRR